MIRRSEKIHPLALIAVGALALAAGVWLATRWLPEWRGGLPEEAFFVQRFRELSRQAGVRLPAGAGTGAHRVLACPRCSPRRRGS